MMPTLLIIGGTLMMLEPLIEWECHNLAEWGRLLWRAYGEPQPPPPDMVATLHRIDTARAAKEALQ